jgi:hypothetical protein
VIHTAKDHVYSDVLKTLIDTTFAFKFDDAENLFYVVTADFLTTG